MHSNVLPIFSLLAYSSRLILLRLLLLSLSSSSLSSNSPSPSYSSFYCVLFLLYPFFYLYSRSISLPLYSTLSLFGNAALLALLFPIYASLLKCPSFFSSFFSLPHWSLSFSPSFFSLIVAHPPLPLSLFIRPFLRLLRPLPRPLLFMGHISPSVPLFSLQSALFPSCPPFFDIPIPLFFPCPYCRPALFSPQNWSYYSFRIAFFHPIVVPPLPSFSYLPRPFRSSSRPSASFSPPNGSHYSFRPPFVQSMSFLPSSPSMSLRFKLFPMSDPCFSV